MPQTEADVEIIAINWEGPFSYREIPNGDHDDFSRKGGLYQIYCNHFETNTLMYIGVTEDSFSSRINNKRHWLDWESKIPEIYLGKIVNLVPGEDHHSLLMRCERFLIYFCCPPVNKQQKDAFGAVSSDPNTVIINYNRRFRLPYVVSNLAEKPHIFVHADGSVGQAREQVREADIT